MGRRAQVLAQVAFGVVLLAFLVLRVDFDDLTREARTLHPAWAGVVLLIPHVGVLISALKWRGLLAALDVKVRRIDAFLLYLVGTFFNNFLPSQAGGDLVRTFQLGRQTRGMPRVAAATFFERAVGFAALLTLLPLFFTDVRLRAAFPAMFAIVPILAVLFVGFMALILSERPAALLRLLPAGRVHLGLSRCQSEMSELARRRKPLQIAYGLSLGFYGIAILTVYCACRAVGLEVGIPSLGAVVPAVIAFSLLPVSLNGLGLSEAGYVMLFTALGVAPAEALVVGLLLRARVWLTAALGGLTFVLRRAKTTDAFEPARDGPHRAGGP